MTLDQLSAAATEGEWISIQSSINPDRHYITNKHHAIFASEIGGAKPADLKFVTSLVNAYRTGQLVAVADDAIERVGALTPEMEQAGIEASEDHFIMDSITIAGLHKFYQAAVSKAKATNISYKQGYADGFARAIDDAVEAAEAASSKAAYWRQVRPVTRGIVQAIAAMKDTQPALAAKGTGDE